MLLDFSVSSVIQAKRLRFSTQCFDSYLNWRMMWHQIIYWTFCNIPWERDISMTVGVSNDCLFFFLFFKLSKGTSLGASSSEIVSAPEK